jgi:hypothetical protein
MTHIVKRLIDADRDSVQRTLGSRIFKEAADYISQLETALSGIQHCQNCHVCSNIAYHVMHPTPAQRVSEVPK